MDVCVSLKAVLVGDGGTLAVPQLRAAVAPDVGGVAEGVRRREQWLARSDVRHQGRFKSEGT